MRGWLLGLLAALGACHGTHPAGTPLALRPACADTEYWSGTACVARGDGEAVLAAGKAALAKSELDEAKATLARVRGPLAHAANVTWWEQKGIAAAFLDDEQAAAADFDTVLALDPGHFLSYTLSPKATFVFEKARGKAAAPPAIDVHWASGQKVGDPVPLDVEVLADPRQFLASATLFVRTRGDTGWRAADVALDPKKPARVVLPPVVASAPKSYELYLRAYDRERNEVLVWADATRPREIPLRYDPPTPWYRTWWAIAIAGTVAAVGTGVVVYELTLAPPDKVDGSFGVR